MNKTNYFLLIICTFLLVRCALPKATDQTSNVVPVPYESTLEVLNHTCFKIGYDLRNRHAAYVRYTITPSDLQGTANRKNNFKPDPLLPSEFSAQDEDYYKSGFDRGHLCPAADMKVSQTCMDESFYYSNMSPQLPGFNRGIWKKLEGQVREWCMDADSLCINTGPIFSKSDTTLDANKVKIPQQYYKTVLRYKNRTQTMIAFVLKNESSNQKLEDFAVSVDKVETLTEIDFYEYLSDDVENQMESSVIIPNWFKE